MPPPFFSTTRRRAALGLAGAARALVCLVCLVCTTQPSAAGFGAPRFLPPDGPYRLPPRTISPAERYASLDHDACEAELGRRGIAFARAQARGVVQPVRLAGPLHGVTFRTGLPASQRAVSPLEIADCRLVLALDDFSAMLAAHDVVEVVHFSMYRPPPLRWPADRPGSRHAGGLAIDASTFVKRDGTTLLVERDFHGRIGVPPCRGGPGPQPATPPALELRQIVCDAAEAQLFNVALTPDFNWPHRNHFHLEVTASGRNFYLR